MNVIRFLSALILAALCCPEYWCDGAVQVHINEPNLEAELPTILKAADRNRCEGDNFIVLLAIRKAENGRPGLEFGITHPRCLEQIRKEPHRSLDIQAGWSAATIVKNRVRWFNGSWSGKEKEDFIEFLGNRYCPASVDPKGNINFKNNVCYWYEKFKGTKS